MYIVTEFERGKFNDLDVLQIPEISDVKALANDCVYLVPIFGFL